MAFELSSLKIRRTSSCKPENFIKKSFKSFSNDNENQAIDNEIE